MTTAMVIFQHLVLFKPSDSISFKRYFKTIRMLELSAKQHHHSIFIGLDLCAPVRPLGLVECQRSSEVELPKIIYFQN